MTRRQALAVAASLGVAVLLIALGAAARPLFTDDRHPPAPVLNAAEIGFAQDMLAHHNQALIMITRLDQAADPTVVALAHRIDATQRDELGELKGWLRLAGAPMVNPAPMEWMHTDPAAVEHHHGAAAPSAATHNSAMPGMASQAELDALSASRGTEAAALFLQMMTRHHYGGVQMARTADTLLVNGVVEQTARDMMTSQAQEAGLMEIMLSSLATRR